MKRILFLRGLPAAGKSRYARELIDKNPGVYKRVNKDDLRAMLDGSHWTKHNENFVLDIRDEIIRRALHDGKHVIVDDTNFSPKHLKKVEEIAKEFDTTVEVKFFDTPLDECIERDRKREKPVGAKVIREMHNRYLRKDVQPVAKIENALPIVICDLDGTLAIHQNRSPYDAEKCETDLLNQSVATILANFIFDGDVKVVFLTGREEKYREQTRRWLNAHGFTMETLFMRPTGDTRKDQIVKQEIYEREIKGIYNVIAVFDDRARVCRMWYSLGLPLYRVGDPDAEF